jgi:hypothetical protein
MLIHSSSLIQAQNDLPTFEELIIIHPLFEEDIGAKKSRKYQMYYMGLFNFTIFLKF